MRTDVARNLASLLARIPTDCRYARDAFFLLQNQLLTKALAFTKSLVATAAAQSLA